MEGETQTRRDGATEVEGSEPRRRARQTQELSPGQLLGRYVVRHRVGGGAMGVVYAGYDPELDRTVALKLVRSTGDAGPAPAHRARLVREAQAQAKLSHGNIVTVLDAGVVGDQVFIAMEYVDGVTLREWLAAHDRSWQEIVRVFAGAGRGLHAAHAAGLVHRDFKPDNVLIGQDGRARVTDFGLVRAVDTADDDADAAEASPSHAPDLTRTGSILGTPLYMSPEQHRGQTAGPAADQFGFCAALYEALYGQHPYADDDAHTARDIAGAVLGGKLREPPGSSSVPQRVHRVVVRGLSLEVADRFPSMAALLAELERDPRGRRTMWLAGGAVAAIAAIALFAASRAAVAPAPCQGADRYLRGVWDGDVRATLASAFGALEAPYAADTWTRLDESLGDYAGRWVAARTDACEATRVRGDQSEQLMDARVFCLDRRLDELGALVEALRDVDRESLQKVVSAAAALTPVAVCSDVRALSEAVAPPADPSAQARIETLRKEFESARALVRLGRIRDADEVVAGMVDRAIAEGYRPLEAEVLVESASMQENLGRFDESVATLERAALAARAGGDARSEARAWLQRAKVLAESLGRVDQANAAMRHADAVIEHSGEAGATVANREGVMCNIELAAGRFEQAIERCRRALAAWEALGPDHEVNAAGAEMMLANLHRRRYEDDLAAPYYESALRRYEAIYGPDHPFTMHALTNLGTSLMDRRKFDEAQRSFEKSLKVMTAEYGADHPSVAWIHNHLGSLLRQTGDYERSIEHHKTALTIRKQKLGDDHPLLGASWNNLGAAYVDAGRFDDAIEAYRSSIAITVARSGPRHPDLAASRFNLGDVLRERGRLAEAMTEYELARDIATEGIHPESSLVAYALTGIGQVYLARNAPARAIAPLERALSIHTGERGDSTAAGYTSFQLARALWATGKRARADELAADARRRMVDLGAAAADELAELDAWLAAR